MPKIKYQLALFFFLSSFLFFFFAGSALAQDKPINVYFFWGEGCPHCAQEKPFLAGLGQKYPSMELHSFEIYYDDANLKLLVEAGNALGAKNSGVPLTIVGDEYVSGWQSDSTTGQKLEALVEKCLRVECPDVIGPIVGSVNAVLDGSKNPDQNPDTELQLPDTITVPLLGDIDVSGFSLPVLTIIMGALDGFNPCAMWSLLFLITLLLGMKNRRKMWILGVVFLLTSAISYFVFMAAWLNLLLFLGLVLWIRIIIGLVALGGGSYNIREFFKNKAGTCKVTGGERKNKVFEKLKTIVQEKNFWFALGGIIALGFAVNLVELICSAGLPAVYTQILALNNLSGLNYYGYIALYILIFLLDDLIVFFIAMMTLKITGVTSKYSRWSYLIGGILMLIIGLLLLLKPEWLMFG